MPDIAMPAPAGAGQETPGSAPDADPFEGRSTGFEARRPRGPLRLLPWCLLLLMLGGAALSLGSCPGPDQARVSVGGLSPKDRRVARVSTETSDLYRENLDAWSEGRAQEAREQGGSFVAPAAGPRPAPKPAPAAAPAKAAAPAPGPEPAAVVAPAKARPAAGSKEPPSARPRPDPRVLAQLQALMQETRAAPRGLTVVFSQPRDRTAAAPAVASAGTATRALPGGLRPGDILYAVSRVTLDSDQPGPAMAEIVAGPLRGARVVGSFQRQGERLVLRFTELVAADGASHGIDAYAVDPRTDRTAVASGVDSHFLERWGGLVAASFLEGFGDAVRRSGTSSYSSAYGSGWSAPDYSVGDETWIAAGKVGERLAKKMDSRFDAPPTVVLESGTEIGVLVLRRRDAPGDGGSAAVRTPVVVGSRPAQAERRLGAAGVVHDSTQ